MIEQPEAISEEIADFLQVADAAAIERFLLGQREAPTPFSSPTSDLRQMWESGLPDQFGERVLMHAGEMAARLGYGEKNPRPATPEILSDP